MGWSSVRGAGTLPSIGGINIQGSLVISRGVGDTPCILCYQISSVIHEDIWYHFQMHLDYFEKGAKMPQFKQNKILILDTSKQ